MPTLSNAAVQSITRVSAEVSVATDSVAFENVIYWVVTGSSSRPTATQIMAGQNHQGAPADASGNDAATSAGQQPWRSATGLVQNKQYWVYFIQFQTLPVPVLSPIPDRTVQVGNLPDNWDLKPYETTGSPGVTYTRILVADGNRLPLDDGILHVPSDTPAGLYRIQIEARNETGVALSNELDYTVASEVLIDFTRDVEQKMVHLRASPKHYENSMGAIDVVNNDISAMVGTRQVGDGWAHENVSYGQNLDGGGTNLLAQSSNFGDTAAWLTAVATREESEFDSPLGEKSWLFKQGSANGNQGIVQFASGTPPATRTKAYFRYVLAPWGKTRYIKFARGGGFITTDAWLNLDMLNMVISSSSRPADFNLESILPVGNGFFEVTVWGLSNTNPSRAVTVTPLETDLAGREPSFAGDPGVGVLMSHASSSLINIAGFVPSYGAYGTLAQTQMRKEFANLVGSNIDQIKNNFAWQVSLRMRVNWASIPDGAHVMELSDPSPGYDNYRCNKTGPLTMEVVKTITTDANNPPDEGSISYLTAEITFPSGQAPLAGEILDVRGSKRSTEESLGKGHQVWATVVGSGTWHQAQSAVDGTGEGNRPGQHMNGFVLAMNWASPWQDWLYCDVQFFRFVPNALTDDEVLSWPTWSEPAPILTQGLIDVSIGGGQIDVPVITGHPSAQTITEGNNIAFSVVATGTAPLNYEWQAKPAGTQNWTALDNHFASVDNPNTANPVARNVAAGKSCSVRSRASNAGGTSAWSNEAVITVQEESGTSPIIFSSDFADDAGYTSSGQISAGPTGFMGAFIQAPSDVAKITVEAGEGVDNSNAAVFYYAPHSQHNPGGYPATSNPCNTLGLHLTNDRNRGYDEVYIRLRWRLPENFRMGNHAPGNNSYWKWGRLHMNNIPVGDRMPGGSDMHFRLSRNEVRPDSSAIVFSINSELLSFAGQDVGQHRWMSNFSVASSIGRGAHKGSLGCPRYKTRFAPGDEGDEPSWEGYLAHFGAGAGEEGDLNYYRDGSPDNQGKWTDPPRSGGWHTIEWRYKCSSGPYVQDGIGETFFDGHKQHPAYLEAKGEGDNVPEDDGSMMYEAFRQGAGMNYFGLLDNMVEIHRPWQDEGIDGRIRISDIVVSRERIGHEHVPPSGVVDNRGVGSKFIDADPMFTYHPPELILNAGEQLPGSGTSRDSAFYAAWASTDLEVTTSWWIRRDSVGTWELMSDVFPNAVIDSSVVYPNSSNFDLGGASDSLVTLDPSHSGDVKCRIVNSLTGPQGLESNLGRLTVI